MKKMLITTFEDAVNYLYNVPRFTNKNSMEDTKTFLHKLGDPDRKMRIIHVAGTNGKGSVCAYIRSILETAGYTTAVFTSPHLVDIRERFVVEGRMVDREEFLEKFLEIYEMLDWNAIESGAGYHPTFFEYLFFMGMLIFAEHKTDFCILETGLGGRLDATNAVTQKELAVITRISLEHVQYLGNTIAKIAGEKAGIMQEGTPVVYADVEPDATAVFARKAEELGILSDCVSKKEYDFLDFHNKNIDFSLHTRYYGYVRLTLQTLARYQMENAALAVRAVEVLDKGRTITKEQIADGVKACIWQGRMEEIFPDVYVDGAHNEDGIRAFLDSVKEDGHEGVRTLLFGVVDDKDYTKMIRELISSGLFSKIALTPLHTTRGVPVEKLEELLNQNKHMDKEQTVKSTEIFDGVETALRALCFEQQKDERIYVAGSLYLVGEVKEWSEHIKESQKHD
ncbi:MAG: bifunctional folylpolyglutamate synthase/dihydrofolate synthase [Acetatifactor sp.]|nr:bifunctional folylpolyglutamate synthase/dihydrofolate synthase [Acetatifactor sp.]